MAFQYPPKDTWEDRMEVSYVDSYGTEVVATYIQEKNLWIHRVVVAGTNAIGVNIYTDDVLTVPEKVEEIRETLRKKLRTFDIYEDNDLARLDNQAEVNVQLVEHLRKIGFGIAHLWYGNEEPPRDPETGELLYQFWWNTDEHYLYFWDPDDNEWVLIGGVGIIENFAASLEVLTNNLNEITNVVQTLVEELGSISGEYLKKHGDDVDDALGSVTYSWNQPLSFSSEENISLTANTSKSPARARILMSTDGSTFIDSTNLSVISDGNTSMYAEVTTNIIGKGDVNLVSNENNVSLGSKKDAWIAAGGDALIEAVGDITLNGVGPTSSEKIPRKLFKDSSPDKQITNKEYVDAQDLILQNEIIELEEELEALAPSLERGTWTFNPLGSAGVGQFALFAQGQITNEYPQADALFINSVDTSGTLHAFTDITVDSYVEVFSEADADYGLYQIKAIHDETDGASSFWHFEVEHIRSNRTDSDADGVCRFKFFELSEGADATTFVRKTGDEMSGDLTFLSTYDAYHHDATTASTRIEFENTKSDGTVSKTYLYKLGTLDGIASSGQFRCKGSLSVSNDIIGWDASNGGIYNSRIALDSGGGRIKWGSTEIAAWASGGFYYYGDVTNDKHFATKEYVDSAVGETYSSSGKVLGEWFASSSNSEPGSQCNDKGEAKKYISNSELYISFRDRSNVDHEDYFSSLKVGDKLYYQKRDQGNSMLEEATITSIQLDPNECRIRIKPYDIFELSNTYILYDGKPQATASVPSPNGYYLSLTGGDGRSAPTDLKITDEYIWKMNNRGELSTSSAMNGVFIPYAWLKRRYPNFSGFNPMEGINKSFINDGSTNRKAIFDPYGNANFELVIPSKIFNNVSGIAFYSTSRDISPVSNTRMELYGIQEAVYFN